MATTGSNPPSLGGDMRESNYTLRQALELALYERFCLKRQALILHGIRHGALPSFALLDADRKLILVKVARGPLTMSAGQKAIEKLKGYVTTYLQLTLQDHATWYCQHGVDLAAWFEYRGPHCYQQIGQNNFGWINMVRDARFKHYRGGDVPSRALEILREDYQLIVGGTLDGLNPESTLQVSRCILIAESWDPNLPPYSSGVPLELWRYLSPAQWLVPSSAQP